MSALSDLWHGIRSGFDINKMKRDPLGAAGKIAMIYGIGSTAYGAFDPAGAKKVGDWMRGGFGLYPNNLQSATYQNYQKSVGQGFLERTVKGVGGFLASPFEFGRDLRGWYNGKLSWTNVKDRNFGWLNTQTAADTASRILAGRGSGERGVPSYKKVAHRDFRGNVFPTQSANISNFGAGQTSAYKPGGYSQGLITAGITPETLAMLGYRAGQVAGSGGQTVDLEDVAPIKTTLTSAIG
tara:strand:+ start:2107 stop:2823 length:717 start_codon:yes stop_codon:yes gene_type:complete